ncbi:MerR family transcriptional regulator [Paenibacillus turpanensis]|uniref:MerR family transcriptional regulator n=1 Tax=Paenibacillus turpanensis TaxID=2689078 RepID=UPI00140B727F|nr:B12-binding domain-containing protein [Paenibacillus turpanensis]
MKQRLYTIKEVSLRTGISTQLIRKWEERYEAVKPTRFPNGYRGYTKEDMEKLTWLKSRVGAGVPIGLAVQDYQGDGPDEGKPEPAAGTMQAFAGGAELSHYRESLLEAFLTLDQHDAQRLFDRLLALHSMDFVLMEVVKPVLIEIGERWERGELSEFQEHFASHFMRDRLLAVQHLFQAYGDRPMFVTGCAPGERHEMGILYFGFYALQVGYKVVFLGTSPAEKGILDCLRQFRPAAFAFSVSTEERIEEIKPLLLQMDCEIEENGWLTKVFIGGRCVTEDAVMRGTKHIYFVSGCARDAVGKIKRLVDV